MCTTLYDSANNFLHQHFVEVSVSEEFLGLRTEELLELVGCDELNIKAEEQVSRSAGAPVACAGLTAVLHLCRCWRRFWPGFITTGTKGNPCCRSCCRRSGCLCADLSS